MKVTPILAIALGLISLSLPACDHTQAQEKGAKGEKGHGQEHAEHQEHQSLVVTSPLAKDVTVTQPYVCQIRSRNHINVCPLQDGYLEEIPVKEGQAVKKGQVLFQVLPTLYKARRDAEVADARLQQRKFDNTKALFEKKVVSFQELQLAQSELDRANARAQLAQAELDFTTVTASFDGIIDRLNKQQGSLVKKEDVLTTLSDNSVMWVTFNVPEARYFEFKAQQKAQQGKSQADQQQFLKLVDSRIELVLADGNKFNQSPGDTVTVKGEFNNETGNIQFRADFPNPDGLLRHGQTGNILIRRVVHGAVVIPQRATFEILDKQYVFVVGEDHVVHQRLITIQYELEDIFVIKSGLEPKDKIILDGVKQVHDGQKVEYEFRKPEEALGDSKHHAE